MHTVKDIYGPILFHYDLYPEQIEMYGQVKKVITRRGVFALKETNMTHEQLDWFLHVMRRLTRIGFDRVAPLLPTKYGDYHLTVQNRTYYLMPWMESHEPPDKQVKEQKIAEQMAITHRLTEKKQVYSKETVEQSYLLLLKRWETRQLEAEQMVEQIEAKIYMSPFELTYLTNVHRVMQMIDEAKQHLKIWYERCQEQEAYRSVLCHSRLSRHHALFDSTGQAYFINFERATLDTPARDLAQFFRRSFQFSLWDEEECLKWLRAYEGYFFLKDEEKHLFFSYLSFPEPIFHAIDYYRNDPDYLTELEHVRKLEKRLLMMKKVRHLTKKWLDDGQKPLTNH